MGVGQVAVEKGKFRIEKLPRRRRQHVALGKSLIDSPKPKGRVRNESACMRSGPFVRDSPQIRRYKERLQRVAAFARANVGGVFGFVRRARRSQIRALSHDRELPVSRAAEIAHVPGNCRHRIRPPPLKMASRDSASLRGDRIGDPGREVHVQDRAAQRSRLEVIPGERASYHPFERLDRIASPSLAAERLYERQTRQGFRISDAAQQLRDFAFHRALCVQLCRSDRGCHHRHVFRLIRAPALRFKNSQREPDRGLLMLLED